MRDGNKEEAGGWGLRYVKPVRRNKIKIAKETERSKTATVKLDEEQMRIITDLINEARISIDDIRIEPQAQSSDEAFFHAPSIVMRWVLKIFFCSVSIAIVYGGYSGWDSITASGNIFAIIVIVALLTISSLATFIIGLSIGEEESKTYIVSLFSAVVALVALGVAYFK